MDQQRDREEKLSLFNAIAPQCEKSKALEILNSADWDVEAAVNLWQQEYGDDFSDEQNSASLDGQASSAVGGPSRDPVSAPGPSSSTARSSRVQGGLRTLSDLPSGNVDNEGPDSDSDNDQDFFAGGEKSGLAVQNPGRPSNPRDAINSIIDRARRQAPRPGGDDEPAQTSHFTGRGVTLGGDDAPSRVIEDPTANVPKPPPRVQRILHLWQDGFSVDDGPLFRYDDPANANTLQMINSGRAPLDLLDVAPNQEVDLMLDNQKDNKYVAPKKKYKPFEGKGQRLGSPTPALASSSSAAVATTSSSSSSPAPGASAAAVPAAPDVQLDSSQPTVTLQIRLGDSTRLQSRFNSSHTVGNVYEFVNASSVASTQRPYVLMTTFPSKDLNDKEAKLGDIAELKKGGVVVQKWT